VRHGGSLSGWGSLEYTCSILTGWLMIVSDLTATACSPPGWMASPDGMPGGAT
jgi:hypothetical protein